VKTVEKEFPSKWVECARWLRDGKTLALALSEDSEQSQVGLIRLEKHPVKLSSGQKNKKIKQKKKKKKRINWV